MKTVKSMMRFALMGIISWGLYSCSSNVAEPETALLSTKGGGTIIQEPPVYCKPPKVVNLMAGQHIVSGTVTVGNDALNLYVTFVTVDGWLLNKTHLYVGAPELLPVNNANNPQIGKFPYSTTHSPRVTSFTYTIPLAGLPDTLCIAAHAEVVKVNGSGTVIQGETAWGEGEDIGGKSWAMKFKYIVQRCEPPGEEEEDCFQEETAWVNGTRYNIGQGNWATYTSYNGSGKIEIIYAGQTIPVGTAIFSAVVDGEVNIMISLTDGWVLNQGSETVKIQGYNMAPSGNPAPGLFTTYKGTDLNLTLDIFNYYGIHLDVRKVISCD